MQRWRIAARLDLRTTCLAADAGADDAVDPERHDLHRISTAPPYDLHTVAPSSRQRTGLTFTRPEGTSAWRQFPSGRSRRSRRPTPLVTPRSSSSTAC